MIFTYKIYNTVIRSTLFRYWQNWHGMSLFWWETQPKSNLLNVVMINFKSSALYYYVYKQILQIIKFKIT